MASLFARDIGTAYRRAERRDKPDSFLETIGKGLATGIATGAGQKITEELIEIPVQRYKQAQDIEQQRFNNTELISSAKRNHTLAFNQYQQLKDAQTIADQQGISLTDARANMPALISAADQMLLNNDQFNSAAFDPEERKRITLSYRKKFAEDNAAAYDAFMAKAKGLTTPAAYAALAENAYSREKGALKSLSNFITRRNSQDLAQDYFKATPEFQKSIEANDAMTILNANRNGNTALKALVKLQRSELPDSLKDTYLKEESETSLVPYNKGFVKVRKTKITNQATNETDTISTRIPDSYVEEITPDMFQVKNLLSYVDTNGGFTKQARTDMLKSAEELVKQKIGQVRNSVTGELEDYDPAKSDQYTGMDGLNAQNIYLEQMTLFAKDKRNFVDVGSEKAKMLTEITKAAADYGITFGTLKNAIDKNTRIRPDGTIVALDDNGFPLPDQTSAKAQGIIRARQEGQREIAAIETLFESNYKLGIGVKQGLIDITTGDITLSLAGETKTLPQTRAKPVGALGYNADAKQFLFGPDVSDAEAARRVQIYQRFIAGDIPDYGTEIQFDPKRVRKEPPPDKTDTEDTTGAGELDADDKDVDRIQAPKREDYTGRLADQKFNKAMIEFKKEAEKIIGPPPEIPVGSIGEDFAKQKNEYQKAFNELLVKGIPTNTGTPNTLFPRPIAKR